MAKGRRGLWARPPVLQTHLFTRSPNSPPAVSTEGRKSLPTTLDASDLSRLPASPYFSRPHVLHAVLPSLMETLPRLSYCPAFSLAIHLPSSRSRSPILAGRQILRETCLLHQACSAQKSDGRHWTQRCRHRPPGSGEPPERPPDTAATPPTGSPPSLRGSHRPPTPAASSKLTPFLGSIPRFTPCWAQIPLLTCLPLVQASLRVSEPGLITEERQG